MQIRRATRADLPWIEQLVRESFDERLLPYLVAAQSGIGRWWELIVQQPHSFSSRQFLVAVDPGGVRLGYAEFRYDDESGEGFLSYVAVAPTARGRGVARGLMTSFYRSHPGLLSMELDVFESNAPARRLYDRLGFEPVGRTSWWEAELEPAGAAPNDVAVDDLHAVMARHAVYGFTDFVLTTPWGSTRYGVLGDGVLRCFSDDSFRHADEHAAVRGLFPGVRRRFVVTSAAAGEFTGSTYLISALRLRATRFADLEEN